MNPYFSLDQLDSRSNDSTTSGMTHIQVQSCIDVSTYVFSWSNWFQLSAYLFIDQWCQHFVDIRFSDKTVNRETLYRSTQKANVKKINILWFKVMQKGSSVCFFWQSDIIQSINSREDMDSLNVTNTLQTLKSITLLVYLSYDQMKQVV